MPGRRADLIRLFEAELDFIDGGGYEPRAGQPIQEKPMFSQSLVCIEHWLIPERKPGCGGDCILMDWVPPEFRTSAAPCHFIPLTSAGETVKMLMSDQERLEAAVKAWLRDNIERMKQEDQTDAASAEVTY
jgi:hypothetical protein